MVLYIRDDFSSYISKNWNETFFLRLCSWFCLSNTRYFVLLTNYDILWTFEPFEMQEYTMNICELCNLFLIWKQFSMHFHIRHADKPLLLNSLIIEIKIIMHLQRFSFIQISFISIMQILSQVYVCAGVLASIICMHTYDFQLIVYVFSFTLQCKFCVINGF